MNEDLTAVLIVAIVFSFVSFSVYLNYRSKRFEGSAGDLQDRLNNENIALKAKAHELEGRIQVLESIVTSKNFSLGEEIDSLS